MLRAFGLESVVNGLKSRWWTAVISGTSWNAPCISSIDAGADGAGPHGAATTQSCAVLSDQYAMTNFTRRVYAGGSR